MLIHCAQCVKERPDNVSMRDYARLQVEIREHKGLRIVCARHNKAVWWCTPDDLEDMISKKLECDLCKQGIPHSHND